MRISGGGATVEVLDAPTDGACVAANAKKWLKGWYGTPDAKVSTTERKGAHGSFGVDGDGILYASRVVTASVVALGRNRAEVVSAAASVSRMAGRVVSVAVDDGSAETEVVGCYLSVVWDQAWVERAMPGTVTVVCPDPRRRSTTPMRGYMVPAAMGALGGLAYSRAHVLAWPLDWGEVPEAANSCTLANRGTATAHPTITLSGTLAAGATVTHAAGQLAYGMPIQPGAPVVLDCLSRTASCNGVDVTRWLSRRDFPSVPAGGSLRLSLMATGPGSCEAEARDTYI